MNDSEIIVNRLKVKLSVEIRFILTPCITFLTPVEKNQIVFVSPLF